MRARKISARVRLFTSTLLAWGAVRIAPWPMNRLLAASYEVALGFPAEMEKGRTFGAVVIPWAEKGNEEECNRMALVGAKAIAEERIKIESGRAA